VGITTRCDHGAQLLQIKTANFLILNTYQSDKHLLVMLSGSINTFKVFAGIGELILAGLFRLLSVLQKDTRISIDQKRVIYFFAFQLQWVDGCEILILCDLHQRGAESLVFSANLHRVSLVPAIYRSRDATQFNIKTPPPRTALRSQPTAEVSRANSDPWMTVDKFVSVASGKVAT